MAPFLAMLPWWAVVAGQSILLGLWRYYLLPGGRRAGKSQGMFRMLVDEAARGKRVLICRDARAHANDGALQLCRDIAREVGYAYAGGDYTHHMDFPGGGRIWVLGTEATQGGLTGIEDVDYCVFEEAQTISRARYELIEPGISKPGSKIIVMWNPDFDDHWAWELWQRPYPNTWTPGRVLTWRDNPAPSQETLDMVEAQRDDPNFDWRWRGHLRNMTGAVFQPAKMVFVDTFPETKDRPIRWWDCAATEGPDPDADWTVGALLYRLPDDTYFLADIIRGQWGPDGVRQQILAAAASDPHGTIIGEEQEPGSSGKTVVANRRKALAGFTYRSERSTGPKHVRADGFATAVNGGLVLAPRGALWWPPLRNEMAAFTANNSHRHDDQIDACSAAYNYLVKRGRTASVPLWTT